MEMNAIVVTGPLQVNYETVPVKKPGPGEALIEIKAAGLCGTDYEILTNELSYFVTGRAKLPQIPGHEWSGVVIELGEGVNDFRPGDMVTGECTVSCGLCQQCQAGRGNLCVNRTETGVMNRDGGYAQYITFPVTHLHRFTKLSFDEGAVVEPTCIAVQAVLRGRVGPRDTVLVIGPGPIGLLAAQACKKVFGARRVIVSGTRDDRLNRALEYVDGVVNVKNEDLADGVRRITGGGVDVVIEAAGSATAFTDAAKVLNPGGRMVLNGFFGNKQAPCPWDFFCTNNIDIIGSLGSPGIWDDVIGMIEDGRIDVKGIISHRMSMRGADKFMAAVELMRSRRDNVCKIILYP